MTLSDLHKILKKPDGECEGYELHLKNKWKHNYAKAIFEITGLDVSMLLTEPRTYGGIIIKNPDKEGDTYYV
jgi:hypothetical protein